MRAVADNYYSSDTRPLSWYRLMRGWSQKELAARVGTSQSYIARLEAGDIDPQVSTLQRLASVFEVPAAALLEAIVQKARQS
jgi:transcriptional regulator with XRE-family HTH domain